MGSDNMNDGIERFCEAIYMFLQEVDGYRKVCMRHDPSTQIVTAKNNTLWLKKRYKNDQAILTHTEKVIGNLEGWEHSTFRNQLADWEETEKRIARERNLLMNRGVAWEGLPVLVTIHLMGDEIQVSTGQMATHDLIDGFSLKRASRGLGLHESLAPSDIWEPVAVAANRNGDFPIRAYLRRTLPNDLIEMKCLEYWQNGLTQPLSVSHHTT